jgi:hypothetical protein
MLDMDKRYRVVEVRISRSIKLFEIMISGRMRCVGCGATKDQRTELEYCRRVYGVVSPHVITDVTECRCRCTRVRTADGSAVKSQQAITKINKDRKYRVLLHRRKEGCNCLITMSTHRTLINFLHQAMF